MKQIENNTDKFLLNWTLRNNNMSMYYDINYKNIWYKVKTWDVLFINKQLYKVINDFTYSWNINDNFWYLKKINVSKSFIVSDFTVTLGDVSIVDHPELDLGINYIVNWTWLLESYLPSAYISNAVIWQKLLITNIWKWFKLKCKSNLKIESAIWNTSVWSWWYVITDENFATFKLTYTWNNIFVMTDIQWNLTFN